MAVLDRSDLEASSLSDLHSIASQIGLDGFRRLRKAELIDRILGEGGEAPAAAEDSTEEPTPKPRRRRGSSRRARSTDSAEDGGSDADTSGEEDEKESLAPRRARSSRGSGRTTARSSRSSRSRREADEDEAAVEEDEPAASEREQTSIEGEVEVLGNGSAFVRVSPPGSSDDDVYISAAQVRRCELVTGDRVSGPVRRPRRSERYPSLARIDTINGESADEAASAVKYESLRAVHPNEAFVLGEEDPTLQAIAQLTPIGRGSRVSIVGPARAGKTATLRALLAALAATDGLESALVLLGTRPEEVADWEAGPIAPAAALTFAASADAQGQALEHAIETAKRLASRGTNALVAIDSLDGVHPHVARRALAAAKKIEGSGSLTIIATASKPFGGESTVIALDAVRGGIGGFPVLDLLQSGTLRPDALVGEDGAHAIVNARASLIG
jgi:transcription termination factor Rho